MEASIPPPQCWAFFTTRVKDDIVSPSHPSPPPYYVFVCIHVAVTSGTEPLRAGGGGVLTSQCSHFLMNRPIGAQHPICSASTMNEWMNEWSLLSLCRTTKFRCRPYTTHTVVLPVSVTFGLRQFITAFIPRVQLFFKRITECSIMCVGLTLCVAFRPIWFFFSKEKQGSAFWCYVRLRRCCNNLRMCV